MKTVRKTTKQAQMTITIRRRCSRMSDVIVRLYIIELRMLPHDSRWLPRDVREQPLSTDSRLLYIDVRDSMETRLEFESRLPA